MLVYLCTCILSYIHTCMYEYFHTCILTCIHTYDNNNNKTKVLRFQLGKTLSFVRFVGEGEGWGGGGKGGG